jgi:hypothetical protein
MMMGHYHNLEGSGEILGPHGGMYEDGCFL